MGEILLFIDYINSYLDDDYREYIDFVGAKRYFTDGGCLEFAKIITAFIPSAEIYRSKPFFTIYQNHLIVKIDGLYYDAKGLVKQIVAEKEFYLVNDREKEQLSDFIGKKEVSIAGVRIDAFIINETNTIIKEKPNKGIAKLIDTINKNIKEHELEDVYPKLVFKNANK